MQVGLIPPVAHLAEFGDGPFHLILSHLIDELPDYSSHYAKQAAKGAFLLLDNSAHELGQGNDPQTLIRQALFLKAREIALPDCLFDDEKTVAMTTEALRQYHQVGAKALHDFRIQLMIVPQAQTIWKYGQCLMRQIYAFQQVFPGEKFTIGVSKDYEKWLGGLPNLIDRFIKPMHDLYDCDVHMLGWGRQLHVLSAISARYPWIRSTDSAKPFVFAMGNIELDISMTSPKYPTRPDRYFEQKLDEVQLSIARENVAIFRHRAKWSDEWSQLPSAK